MYDKKQSVIDLHNELRQTVGNCRLAHLIAIDELQEFGGKDEYKTSVSIIVDRFGAEGVLVTRLRDVLPDSVDLNEAIKALKDENRIEEVGKGRSIRLVSKNAPAAPVGSAPLPKPEGGPAPAPAVQAKSENEAVAK